MSFWRVHVWKVSRRCGYRGGSFSGKRSEDQRDGVPRDGFDGHWYFDQHDGSAGPAAGHGFDDGTDQASSSPSSQRHGYVEHEHHEQRHHEQWEHDQWLDEHRREQWLSGGHLGHGADGTD